MNPGLGVLARSYLSVSFGRRQSCPLLVTEYWVPSGHSKNTENRRQQLIHSFNITSLTLHNIGLWNLRGEKNQVHLKVRKPQEHNVDWRPTPKKLTTFSVLWRFGAWFIKKTKKTMHLSWVHLLRTTASPSLSGRGHYNTLGENTFRGTACINRTVFISDQLIGYSRKTVTRSEDLAIRNPFHVSLTWLEQLIF